MGHTIEYSVALILLAPAIVTAFIPMVPSLAYMFVVSVLFACIDSTGTLSWANIGVLAAFLVASFITDHLSGLLGAKYGGAHTRSLLWGIVGSIAGTFIMPFFGSFIGLFGGVFAAEIYYDKTRAAAVKAASHAVLGSMVGVGVNVLLAIGFFITFIFLAAR